MSSKKENTDLNLIVATYVNVIQAANQIERAKQEWDSTQALLKHLDNQKVISLSDTDLNDIRLITLELNRVHTMIRQLAYNYDPDVYVKTLMENKPYEEF